MANYITEVTVTDPTTGLDVEVAMYHCPDVGGIFGVDSSFVTQVIDGDDNRISSPFTGKLIPLEEPA